ncbi:hypothetical protein [Candidatus Nitrospira nitrificans]|uniref:Uncharacterized protein n=1 Tax=Candidatus Nitrospira nitrificans TaxID=1742973 RepID=A0A0S4LDP3_9BACT|nr:hypothetical protein [Candidatus Nitrospira nitrificans]CUS34027.1 hypothetical protein COMA2_150065 [Candidatus Nitrospira nitrificans]
MNEKPLERLNYHNGQRLEAADFKAEQDYHIRTKRWLNKSLYSAGIARGLDVRPIMEGPKKDTPFVAVGPGLALDHEGREIILLEEATVEVYSHAGTDESTVVGNYLVIEYAEETIAYEKGGCAVRAEGTSANKSTTNWGGPSRIQARVKFSWAPFVPHPGSNQIVLARVELAEGCKSVRQIDAGARRYIGAASAATVRQYALEGEREVAFIPKESFPPPKQGEEERKDVQVVGRVYFHVRGRQPNSVTLFLKGAEFSPLRYTEMGIHTHSSDVGVGQGANTDHASAIDQHKHSGTTLSAVNSTHAHSAFGFVSNSSYNGTIPPTPGDIPNLIASAFLPYPDGPMSINAPGSGNATFDAGTPPMMLRMVTTVGTSGPGGQTVPHIADMHERVGMEVRDDTGHGHTISGDTGDPSTLLPTRDLHTHPFSASINQYGVKSHARSGNPLTFVNNLQIAIDRVNKTIAIRDQIVDSVPGSQKPAWQLGLGDGTDNHPLANPAIDAVPIRLDFLPGVTFAEGQHVIEFSVGLRPDGEANGGKILYNLYVE